MAAKPLKEQVLLLTNSSGRVDDPKTWSFTPSRVLEQLTPRFAQCETLSYELAGWADRYRRATLRFLKAWNCCRSVYLNPLYERKFLKRWHQLPAAPDVCLHVSDFCLPRQIAQATRHFAYTDATLIRLAPHYPQPISPWFLRQYRRLTRNYLDSIEGVLTMNEWTRQSYIEDYGVPAERVVNVGFGVNLEPFHGEKNWDENLLLIVLRRNTEEVKGLNLLLAAFPKVRRAIPSTRMAVVGTTLPGTFDGVTFYESFPREKTVELFQHATLYTMPALCEVNGVAYLEALASRTPILGLNRFAFPEFSGNGRFGFIVNEPSADGVASTIIAALKSKDALKQMGAEGQRFAMDRYGWGATADRICRVFEQTR